MIINSIKSIIDKINIKNLNKIKQNNILLSQHKFKYINTLKTHKPMI